MEEEIIIRNSLQETKKRRPIIQVVFLVLILLIVSFVAYLFLSKPKTYEYNCDKINSLQHELMSGLCDQNLCCFREKRFINCDKNHLKSNDIVKFKIEKIFFPENTTKVCYTSDLIDFFDIYDFCNTGKNITNREKCEIIQKPELGFDFYFIGFIQNKNNNQIINLINMSVFSENEITRRYSLEGYVE